MWSNHLLWSICRPQRIYILADQKSLSTSYTLIVVTLCLPLKTTVPPKGNETDRTAFGVHLTESHRLSVSPYQTQRTLGCTAPRIESIFADIPLLFDSATVSALKYFSAIVSCPLRR
jgi:hypothetical protein